MGRDKLTNEYFDWIFELMCGDRFAPEVSYRKLLSHLHGAKFRYSIPKDRNRAMDGEDLRYRFALQYTGSPYEVDEVIAYLKKPCSVLEMMVALAIRAEETMDDPDVGDRTAQWFWGMINSLGLGSMHDIRYDSAFVSETIDRFLDREYEPDGRGGLFFILDCDKDLRRVEIWHQLCWYMDKYV